MVECLQYREATEEIPHQFLLGGDTGYRQAGVSNYNIEAIREYGLTEDGTCDKIVINPHKEELVKSEAEMREKRRLCRLPSGGGSYCEVGSTQRAGARIHFGKDEDLLDQTIEGGIR